MIRDIISPLVSIDVLDVSKGESVLVPPTWRRIILHREWKDLIAMKRVSMTGSMRGTYGYGGMALPHLGTTKVVEIPEGVPGAWVGELIQDNAPLFAEIPAGFDAILVDEPIRGVIPAPIISTGRISPPHQSSNFYEDLIEWKYGMDKLNTPYGTIVATNPATGYTTYFSSLTFEYQTDVTSERISENNFKETIKRYAIPILFPVAQEVEMTILGLKGNYLLVSAIGEDYPNIIFMLDEVDRKSLLSSAIYNTNLHLNGGALVPAPAGGAIGYLDHLTVRNINMVSGETSETSTPYITYPLPTLRSFLAESDPIPFGNYAFMFVIQLNTPLDQRYHLFSMSSVARVFFGGHYMIEFQPSAGGVGKTRFYFFPKGYHIPMEVWDGSKPPTHPKAAELGTTMTIVGSAEIFLLDAFQPKPIANNNLEKVFPFVYITEISDTDVWSFSKVSPGASAEAFLICPLAGHICIFRYSDIMRSVTDGSPLRPILAFNPLEYVHRNFGVTPLGVTLMQRFSQHVIPPNTSVGLFMANCSAYFSFFDLAWRGYSIATKPVLLAPNIHITKNLAANNTIYNPTSLVGSSASVIPKFTNFNGVFIPTLPVTKPPTLAPVTPTPPTTTISNPAEFLIYPVQYTFPANTNFPEIMPTKTPIVEVQDENLGGTAISPSPVSAVSLLITQPSSQIFDVSQLYTRVAVSSPNGVHIGGVIPGTDIGFSPNYFTSAEDYINAYKNYWGETPKILWEGKMVSARFVPAPPTLKAVDLVRAGVIQQGDAKWESAVDLATIPGELGETAGVIKSVTINLQPDVGNSTATVNLEIPFTTEPAVFESDNILINLPPILRTLLRPFNLVRIRLGYVLMEEDKVLPTLSPIVFEGVITGVSASVSEREAGGRALRVTLNINDIFYRASLATTEDEPPLDGWFLPEVIEHHMVCSGILPDRLTSLLWFPLGAASSYFIGENLFVGNNDAYLLYSDFPFNIDFGLVALADAPRFTVSQGSRRIDVIKQALRLTGAEMIYTPYPINTSQIQTFLDAVLRSSTYERFGGKVKMAISNAKLPYNPPYNDYFRKLREVEVPKVQIIPVGSYATRPTWVFQVQNVVAADIEKVSLAPSIYSTPIALPNQPYVYGIFSLQWQQSAWALPTLATGEGERILGQPFVFSFYDIYHELIDKTNPLFRGFRISANLGRNPNIVDPLQAWMAAWRERLKLGYFPPASATLTLFGMPILAPRHLVGITPALRILGFEDFVVSDPTGGIHFWVVRDVTYEWSAEAPIVRMQVNLLPPHKFLGGIIGLG